MEVKKLIDWHWTGGGKGGGGGGGGGGRREVGPGRRERDLTERETKRNDEVGRALIDPTLG